jgi:hypothetical protein
MRIEFMGGRLDGEFRDVPALRTYLVPEPVEPMAVFESADAPVALVRHPVAVYEPAKFVGTDGTMRRVMRFDRWDYV